jgi:glycosyltransferase involved in cell wall biosynthesis
MISVCMATYNGELFIGEQLDSIISQLDELSEIIIVDDCSTDRTISIIESYEDQRIVVLRNDKNMGVVRSFNRAIENAKHDVVFLSDQDDIWLDNKVRSILEIFEAKKSISLIYGNGVLIDEYGNFLGRNLFLRGVYSSFILQLIRPRFLGCSMAFRKSFKNKIFPLPQDIAMHDWWIGLNHLYYGQVLYLSEPLIQYRRHRNSFTLAKKSHLLIRIGWRLEILMNFINRYFRK